MKNVMSHMERLGIENVAIMYFIVCYYYVVTLIDIHTTGTQ